MLVPRSFKYATPNARRSEKVSEKKRSPQRQNSKDAWRGFGWRPDSYQKIEVPAVTVVDQEKDARPPMSASVPSNGPIARTAGQAEQDAEPERPRSQPVPVPSSNTRTLPGRPDRRIPGTNDDLRSRRRSVGPRHDPRSMSPSTAALLSMTSIPRRKDFVTPTARSSSFPERMSTQQLMDHWEQDYGGFGMTPLSSSPGLDVLLSPPQHANQLSRSHSSSSFGSSSVTRSVSSDSVPSLIGDDKLCSTISSSPGLTYNSPGKGGSRTKTLAAPRILDSVDEDPLLLDAQFTDEDFSSEEMEKTPIASVATSPKAEDIMTKKSWRFRSNLTASLNAIKSSLFLISGFTITPYTLPDNHLSQGLFTESQRIQSEKRPQLNGRTPTPELRRYLNPSAYHLSVPSDFHLHSGRFEHDSFGHMGISSDLEGSDMWLGAGALIAMQDRLSTMDTADKRTAGSGQGITEAGRAMGEERPLLYRRELRENGDFLRICVLETNMRRVGKLEGPGHAQLWLPPRQGDSLQGRAKKTTMVQGRRVPDRWIGECV